MMDSHVLQKADKEPQPLPNNAILEPDRKLFRLRKSSGGTIAKGAFGIYISDTPTMNDKNNDNDSNEKEDADQLTNESDQEESLTDKKKVGDGDDEGQQGESAPTTSQETSTGSWYLFIEEVIYLHERGLLEAYDEMERRVDSYDLYNLLSDHDMPLPVFLVYAHLRQQTFKVVRYSRERRLAIQEQMMQPAGKPRLRFGRRLRQVAAEARPPPLEDLARHLSWDVYPPDATFQRREPGLPSFSVLVTTHSSPFSVDRIRGLVQENDPVTIKVAAVADTGTVIIFGVTNIGSPSITKTTATTTKISPSAKNDDNDEAMQENRV